MRALALMMSLEGVAAACPACVTSTRFNWLHLVLVALPFVVIAVATWAITSVLRDDS